MAVWPALLLGEWVERVGACCYLAAEGLALPICIDTAAPFAAASPRARTPFG